MAYLPEKLKGLEMEDHLEDIELKGTTAIAIRYADGIMIAVDSRSSNESQEIRTHKLLILDDVKKMYQLSDNIACIMIGKRNLGTKMEKHMAQECHEEDTLLQVLETAETYIKPLQGKKKSLAHIIAGHDNQGFHIHSLYVHHDAFVVNKEQAFAVLGTGNRFARDIVEEIMGTNVEAEFNYNLPYANAVKMMERALFNASYLDKSSGGTLKVFSIDNAHSWKDASILEALEAYTLYYDDMHDEQATLLVVFNSASGFTPVYGKDLINFFRQYGGEAKVAHRIVRIHIEEKRGLYLHRLVFHNQSDATTVYNRIQQHGVLHGKQSPAILTQFPRSLVLDRGEIEPEKKIRLYVNRSSRNLLKALKALQDAASAPRNQGTAIITASDALGLMDY